MPDTKRKRPGRESSVPPADVKAFLARLEHPRKREILALREVIRAVDERIAESIKWNAPSFSTTEHFATFHLRDTSAVQIVLHLGAKARGVGLRGRIADPAGLLQWRDAGRATVRFTTLAEVEAKKAALASIVKQWITFVR